MLVVFLFLLMGFSGCATCSRVRALEEKVSQMQSDTQRALSKAESAETKATKCCSESKDHAERAGKAASQAKDEADRAKAMADKAAAIFQKNMSK